jgi:hypothetical protein
MCFYLAIKCHTDHAQSVEVQRDSVPLNRNVTVEGSETFHSAPYAFTLFPRPAPHHRAKTAFISITNGL